MRMKRKGMEEGERGKVSGSDGMREERGWGDKEEEEG